MQFLHLYVVRVGLMFVMLNVMCVFVYFIERKFFGVRIFAYINFLACFVLWWYYLSP